MENFDYGKIQKELQNLRDNFIKFYRGYCKKENAIFDNRQIEIYFTPFFYGTLESIDELYKRAITWEFADNGEPFKFENEKQIAIFYFVWHAARMRGHAFQKINAPLYTPQCLEAFLSTFLDADFVKPLMDLNNQIYCAFHKWLFKDYDKNLANISEAEINKIKEQAAQFNNHFKGKMIKTLENANYSKIQKDLRRAVAKFKEFLVLIEFEKTNGDYLQLKDCEFKKRFDFQFYPADFDFLIENDFKQMLATYLEMIASDKKLFDGVCENTIKGIKENKFEMLFESDKEIAFYTLLFQIAAFAISLQFNPRRKYGEPEINILIFIAFSFIEKKCAALREKGYKNLMAAFDFWVEKLKESFKRKIAAMQGDNEITLTII